MGRPPLAIGTHGQISVAKIERSRVAKDGTTIETVVWRAKTRFRDTDGVTRQVTAVEATQAKARNALLLELRDRSKPSGAKLTAHTRLSKAADLWIERKEREGLRDQTLVDYRGYVQRSIKDGRLGGLTLAEVNDVARIERWLAEIADTRGTTAARQSRKVLSGILAYAERVNAIPISIMSRVKTPTANPGTTGDRKCSDPDCDYDCGKRHLDTKRAFTLEEAVSVQAAADRAKADVGDLAAFLFGTGVRISEALHHVEWDDVDLGARTVHVRGTKTDHADRILAISEDLAERLTARKARHGGRGLVFGITYFATKIGLPRDRNNVAKALRRVFTAAGIQWAGSHTFRRTVATWLDEAGASLAEIANQLGHADINVTARYLGRRTAPTRAAQVMVLPKAPRLSVVSNESGE